MKILKFTRIDASTLEGSKDSLNGGPTIGSIYVLNFLSKLFSSLGIL